MRVHPTLSLDEFIPKAPERHVVGVRVHPLPDDEDEDTMPKGHYPRKKKDETATAAGEQPATRHKARVTRTSGKPGRRARNASTARYGIFSDGTITIDAPSCKGTLQPDEASALLGFIQHANKSR